MSTRVNKIRITIAITDCTGVFKRYEYRHYVTTLNAAVAIKNISAFGHQQKLRTVEVGNSNGWVPYEVEEQWSIERLDKAMKNAMEMQLAFYDDGETA